MRFSTLPSAVGASSSWYAARRKASVARSAPAAGSITYGTYRRSCSWSKYERSSPENLRVLGEVVVAAVRDALELAPAPRVLELHVRGSDAVVRELVGIVRTQPQHLRRDAEVLVPAEALLAPVLVPLLRVFGRDEELHLHLLELTGAEDEVARRDLVAERLADLRDAERRLLARRRLHVLEVDEDALRGLRAQVRDRRVVLHRTDVGLEHQVEVAGLGERVLHAAVRARARLRQLVRPEPLLAVLAVHQGVREGLQVAAGLPDLGGHQDRRIEAHDVVAVAGPSSATRRPSRCA